MGRDSDDDWGQAIFNIVLGLPIYGLSYLGAKAWLNKGKLKDLPDYFRYKEIEEDIRRSWGVFFGDIPHRKFRKTYHYPIIRDLNADGHVLVVGGAGSGKSSCIAIPTLKRYWDGRFLAIDIKGELAEKSSRQALVFNPSDASAYGYNPFYLVEKSNNPRADIRTIALTLVPASTTSKDPFWTLQAQSILTGHLLYAYKHRVPFFEALRTVLTTSIQTIIELGINDADCRHYFIDNVNQKDETLGSILGELKNHILPYLIDPDIERALTATKILTPDDLEDGHNIFLQIPEHKLKLWSSMLGLIVQQFLDHFQRRNESTATPVLLLLDEFPALGKIDGIIQGLATLRSKKICICILIQSLAQLDAIYGTDFRRIIVDNCAYKAILRATDGDTQRYFSNLIGSHKVQRTSISQRNFGALDIVLGNRYESPSETVSLVDEPVYRPEELAYLNEQLILLAANLPDGFLVVDKRPYYTQNERHPPSLWKFEPEDEELEEEKQAMQATQHIADMEYYPVESFFPMSSPEKAPRRNIMEENFERRLAIEQQARQEQQKLEPAPKKILTKEVLSQWIEEEDLKRILAIERQARQEQQKLKLAPQPAESLQAEETQDALGKLLGQLNIRRQQSDYDLGQEPDNAPPHKRKR